MKIGACCQVQDIEHVKNAGFDFIELNFSAITGLGDEEFAACKKRCEAAGIESYSFNGFFRGDVKLYEDDSLENVKNHAEKGFARASALDGKIAVIGSGAARSIPDGVDEDCAKKRFTEVLSVCADIAAKYGMKVVVEPLNSNETNFITTVGEGSEIARLSKRKNAGVLVDFYHFTRENESDDALIPVGDILYHVHVATPRDCRGIPEEEDTPTMKKWAQMLKEINYEGYVSLECNHEADIAESYIKAKKMLEFFRL